MPMSTLPAMAELGLRVWSCTRFHDVDFTRVHEDVWRHDPAIGEACIAATLRADERDHHGGSGGRTHVMLAPHAPDTCSDELLRQGGGAGARDRPERVDAPVAEQAGERVIAKRSGCTPTQLLERVGLLNDKLIAAHCIYLTDDDIARHRGIGHDSRACAKGQRNRRLDGADAEAASRPVRASRSAPTT